MKPEDMAIDPYGRGICPVPQCGRSISLKKDGTLRSHGREQDFGERYAHCPGSGKKPPP